MDKLRFHLKEESKQTVELDTPVVGYMSTPLVSLVSDLKMLISKDLK